MEHRRFTRIPFDANAQLYDPQNNKSWNTELIDISLKGVKLSIPADWNEDWETAEHSNFEITLILAKDDVEIKIHAALKHHEETVLGFQTIHIDVDSASHLHRLLELNLGDSKLLDREYIELISPSMP